jgi:hypothetical protein
MGRNILKHAKNIIIIFVIIFLFFNRKEIEVEKIKYVKYPIERKVFVVEEIHHNYLTRNKINKEVEKNINFYIDLYTSLTKNKEISEIIIKVSLEKEIPLNISFAMAYCESSFKVTASNKNENLSQDFGLFQINNKTFPKANYFDIEENTNLGLSYYKNLYISTGSYEISLVFYNAGPVRAYIPYVSLLYADRILTKEREYDKFFNENRYIAFYEEIER